MASTGPLQSFTLFPELPFELRLKIWSFIAPGPRVVGINYRNQRAKRRGISVTFYHNRAGWTSPDPVPIILHISQESRTEGLKSLKTTFGSHWFPGEVYFDFEKDTLHFANGKGMDYLNSNSGPSDYLLDVFSGGGYSGGNDGELVKYMIVDIDENVYGRRSFCWDEIREFTRLQELTLMVWEKQDLAEELMRTYRGSLNRVAKQNPSWKVPKIKVFSPLSGQEWGFLEVEKEEVREVDV
jgi:hypothetical protein